MRIPENVTGPNVKPEIQYALNLKISWDLSSKNMSSTILLLYWLYRCLLYYIDYILVFSIILIILLYVVEMMNKCCCKKMEAFEIFTNRRICKRFWTHKITNLYVLRIGKERELLWIFKRLELQWTVSCSWNSFHAALTWKQDEKIK